MLALRTAAAALVLGLLSPAHLLADWQAGVDAFKAGDFATAAEAFAAEADRRPDWHGARLMLGRALLHQGKVGQAVTALDRARQLAPEDANVRLFLARAHATQKSWPLAAEALAGVDPGALPAKERSTVHNIRAQAALDAGDSETALGELRQLARSNPNDADVHHLLAKTALAAGRSELGVDHLRRVRQLDPGNAAAASLLAGTLFNRALELEGEARARACAEGAGEAAALVELDDRFEHLLLAGRLELCADRAARAEPLLTRAAAAGDDWRASYYLARARALVGSWKAAEKALRPAFAQPLDAGQRRKVHGLMGFIAEGQQRFELAIDHYGKAGQAERVARAQESLEIQRHNRELEELRNKAEALGLTLEELMNGEQRSASNGL